VRYIKELQNEIKEVKEESFKKSKELENKIKELETSQTGTDSAPREPHRSLTDTSEMADLRTGASESSPTKDDHSVILKSLKNKILATPTGASEAESDILTSQESLLASPEEELLGSLDEELLANLEEELLASEEELPEFNWTEDLRRWLEL
jgi:hypothetical protein